MRIAAAEIKLDTEIFTQAKAVSDIALMTDIAKENS
jgi:hypothetical protein